MRRLRPIATAAVLLVVLIAAPVGGGSAAAQSTASDGGQTSGATPAGETCQFPFSRSDATGTTVSVDSDPDRVVALQPSAAQTMWEIGASDEVVGMPVNRYTSYLEGYQRPTNVVAADDFTVNVEAVVNASPDLVLAPNVTTVDTVRQLRDAGLTVYHFGAANTIEDVYGKTLLTGQLTGNCEGAAERTARMRVRIDRVRRAVADEPRPSVVYPLGGGVVAGSDTFLHEMITTAGGSNLAAEAGISGYGQISAEVIVAEDPQWLILNDGLPRSEIQIDAYNETTAIRADQVIRVNPNYANQPAPRVVIVVEQLARALHPEAMAAANETANTVASPTTDDADTPVDTGSPGQPGFGLGAGLIALAVALLAATRRLG